MKKCLVLVLCLLIVSTCSIFAAHSIIDPVKDNVVLEETVLAGDKAAAKGLSVTAHIGASGHLFWDTSCLLDDNNTVLTDFRFSQKEETHFEQVMDHHIMLEAPLDFSAGGVISYDSLNKAVRHVADNTPNSGRHTETVDLKEYYEYFPLNIIIGMDHFYCNTSDIFENDPEAENIAAEFNDFFRFPIINDSYLLSVTIQKDVEGNIIETQVSSMNGSGLYLETVSAVSENSCWFTYKSVDKTVTNAEHIPGGYGIYRLPFSEEESHPGYPVMIHPEDLCNAYPLSSDASVTDIKYIEEYDQIVFATKEDGYHWVTVLDGSSGKELQRIKTMPVCAEGTGIYKVFHQEGLMAILDIDGRFAVMEIDEKGHYEQVLTTKPLEELNEIAAEMSSPEMEFRLNFDNKTGLGWNGEKLAAAAYIKKINPMDNAGYSYMLESCDFFVLVIDEEGLEYAGLYSSSLGGDAYLHAYGWYGLEYYDSMVPLEDTPVTVKWQ